MHDFVIVWKTQKCVDFSKDRGVEAKKEESG